MKISSLFKRPEKYSDVRPKTPAEKAEEEWDRRSGTLVQQNYHLRLMMLGLIVISVALTIGLVMQSLKSVVVPYIVEVDSTSGEVKNVGKLIRSEYTPQEAEIQYFLRQFIQNARAVTLDPVVYDTQMQTLFAFLTQDAAKKMKIEIQNEGQLQKFAHKVVQVKIVSVLPIQGSNSWQIRWNEEEFATETGGLVTTPMSGVFTVTVIPPKDEKILAVNPLGIYIADFSWSKDEAAASRQNQQQQQSQQNRQNQQQQHR